MLTSRHRKELKEKGYTVVEGVLTEGDCDKYRQQYLDWIRDNFDEGTFPDTWNSLLKNYKSGHLAPTWEIRLKCKDVFAQLWGTDRLLTSVDAIAIGRPPEEGAEEFWSEDLRWLHFDQSAQREGLHGYQGAVYLEHVDEDDWTFEVIEGSHNLFADFWKEFPEQREESLKSDFKSPRMTASNISWLSDQGCKRRRVPVPKGDLVLWDSRLVHANANPIKGRRHPDRWRWMVTVCMTPASWAKAEDMALKQKAYNEMLLTRHWPSRGVYVFPDETPKTPEKHPLTELPEVARTVKARRLAGVEPYPTEQTEGEEDIPEPNEAVSPEVCHVFARSRIRVQVWTKRSIMLTSRHREELEERGYTVVEGVLTEGECDKYRQQYLDWIRDNFDEGTFPDTWKSLVHRYKSGHLAPTWEIRLKCKDVFAQLWGTDRLLTSMDAIAIGRPPEEGAEEFWSEDLRWLHFDQSAQREGLHGYQGAVYLEHVDEDDWTFEVIEGSHNLFADFWKAFPEQYEEALTSDRKTIRMTASNISWLSDQACKRRRVPVPKGALVLWDSRLVHANANPIRGRRHPDRWRWMVTVCMTPASWAKAEDMALKQTAYNEMFLTRHWPSRGVWLFPDETPKTPEKHPLTELPEVARTVEARRLAGVEPYPTERAEGEEDIPEPKWHPGFDE
ncbi:hypothetical protein BaRGS_00003970 [Batillaria attramentaria]|uniref:Phytanoyl-CoA dioxygenase n=1 Tax=Batillaria attramentaria TaxID=370345 RepID=A0ABD0M157_9CAEN